jgi:hypothetical protein
MPTIKYKEDEEGGKRIVTKDGKVSCGCCEGDAMIITFTSDGEGVAYGLETRLIDEKNNEACGEAGSGSPAVYLMTDDYIRNTYYYLYNEALANNDWTSSFNIDLYANIDAGDNCYEGTGEQDGDGFCLPKTPYSATCIVEFRGKTKSGSFTTYMIPTGSNCAGLFVGTLIVYSSPLSDGSYFEIV